MNVCKKSLGGATKLAGKTKKSSGMPALTDEAQENKMIDLAVRLAEKHRTASFQLAPCLGTVWRDVALQYARTAGSGHPARADVVLDGDGYAGERRGCALVYQLLRALRGKARLRETFVHVCVEQAV